ncbi:hypothetical protein [Bacillus xiapuensis]|uniref:Uncharacterized protein n=1 Tax=Bacillus xiapuensis TaxID=2014075 RepID=A0ABU6N869_9BACI|nr:hypothetical protein [Bacillus xiapuensis]
MNKVEEFTGQLKDVCRQISELEELRSNLKTRINEESKQSSNEGIFFNNEQLHKLLCYLERTVVLKEAVEGDKDRSNLIDFGHELSWDIAEHFQIDLNEGCIDPKTYEYYTFKSRR